MPMASLFLFLLLPVVLVVALTLILRPRHVKIPLKGRHVFITAASSGIGLAMARRAAAEGARVSILARDRAKLEAARDEIRRATGREVTVYSADVRDAAAVREAVEAAGTIDVLVCNQGMAVPRPLVEQSMEDIRLQIDLNLVGMLNLIKAALPGMKKAAAEDGAPRSIALTTSEGGLVGVYAYSVYCATNFAVRGLAEALQMELISDNIHLSLIMPSETDTPGRAADVRNRTEISHMIAGTSGFLQPDEVARKALNGIKSGKFMIFVTLHGAILSLATAGMSPQRSSLLASAEVMTAGFMRFVGLCYLSKFYKMIDEYHAKMKRN